MYKEISSARREILNILKTHNGMTADSLSKVVGTSAVAVRQHLTTLEAEGYVTSRLERRPVGRPVQVFTLTEAADELFPKTYHQFSLGILQEIRELEGEDGIRRLFENRRKRLLATYSPLMEGKDLQGRVEAVSRIMNEKGYMADWEPSDGGFLLTAHNCVISKVAREYPLACEQELLLLTQLLKAHVTRLCSQSHGDSCC
ncbi:MAG: helix-turn-helix transcriptional regulator, partial [Armatimonadota bacterium]